MRLIIDKESFKSFSKIILTCIKLGEDIFFECRRDHLTIKSVNDDRSSFFFTKFERRFFEEYQVPEAIECKFKAKSCLIPFKSSSVLEKSISTLEFFLDKDKDGATFQMNFDTDDITIHEIGFINTNLQIDLCEDVVFDNYLMAKTKSLVSLFGNFPNANDYFVMAVDEDKIYFETYNFKIKNEVKTAFTVNSEAFLEYKVKGKMRSTFSLRQMKTFLSSLDRNVNCYFYFEEDNCPIHVVIRNNFVEHKFIISSILVDLDSVNDGTTNLQMPTEILPDLNQQVDDNASEKDTYKDEKMETNEDDLDNFSSSSFESDQNVSLDKEKSIKVKSENYKSAYLTETESNSNSNNNRNSIKNHQSTSSQNNLTSPSNSFNLNKISNSQNSVSSQSSSRQTENLNGNHKKSQIIDSQLTLYDDDFDTESNNQQLRTLDNKSQQSSQHLSQQTADNPSQASIISSPGSNHNSLASKTKNQLNTSFIPTMSSNDQTTISNSTNNRSDNFYDQENSEIRTILSSYESTYDQPSNQLIRDPTINQTANNQTANNQTANNQTANNQISLFNDEVTRNQIDNQSANERKSSISHSTQENIDKSIRMDLNLSKIEVHQTMRNLNNEEWMDLDEDILLNESTEKKIKKQKNAYDDYLNKIPPIAESDRQLNFDQNELFSDFMNKNKGSLK